MDQAYSLVVVDLALGWHPFRLSRRTSSVSISREIRRSSLNQGCAVIVHQWLSRVGLYDLLQEYQVSFSEAPVR